MMTSRHVARRHVRRTALTVFYHPRRRLISRPGTYPETQASARRQVETRGGATYHHLSITVSPQLLASTRDLQGPAPSATRNAPHHGAAPETLSGRIAHPAGSVPPWRANSQETGRLPEVCSTLSWRRSRRSSRRHATSRSVPRWRVCPDRIAPSRRWRVLPSPPCRPRSTPSRARASVPLDHLRRTLAGGPGMASP